jgi:GDP-4-dehydro-6-deoxy-D-mannose reductase
MTRRVLVTGGGGFVGQWLSRTLLEHGWTVYAGTTMPSAHATVLTDKERNAIRWTPLDVRSDDSLRQAIECSKPERVAHLAGIASSTEANAAPLRAFEVNALGAMRLLAALTAAAAEDVRVLIVGSAEEYGAHDRSAYPIAESAELRPLTAYAVGKAAQELIALQAFRGSAMQVVCTRSFNHSGVGQADAYLLPTLVTRVRALPRSGGTLRIGNGTVVRDFLHVADVVDAYMALLDKGVAGEVYNVSSGDGMTIRDLAARVLKRAGVTADISSDSALLRPIDVPIMIGDNSKLRQATGWAPQHTVDDIIDDLIHASTR